jgi:hypothetical protein
MSRGRQGSPSDVRSYAGKRVVIISGHNLNVDGGWAGSLDAGVLDPGLLIDKALAAMS